MPGVYDKMGIRFLYPDNWTLDQKDAVGGNLSVTVEAPGGAFWSVAVHPLAIDPEELALTALDALRAEYPAAESEPASELILDQTATGYDVSFFYLDFVNTATIRTLSHARGHLPGAVPGRRPRVRGAVPRVSCYHDEPAVSQVSA